MKDRNVMLELWLLATVAALPAGLAFVLLGSSITSAFLGTFIWVVVFCWMVTKI